MVASRHKHVTVNSRDETGEDPPPRSLLSNTYERTEGVEGITRFHPQDGLPKKAFGKFAEMRINHTSPAGPFPSRRHMRYTVLYR